jgi:hypothetical protein
VFPEFNRRVVPGFFKSDRRTVPEPIPEESPLGLHRRLFPGFLVISSKGNFHHWFKKNGSNRIIPKLLLNSNFVVILLNVETVEKRQYYLEE